MATVGTSTPRTVFVKGDGMTEAIAAEQLPLFAKPAHCLLLVAVEMGAAAHVAVRAAHADVHRLVPAHVAQPPRHRAVHPREPALLHSMTSAVAELDLDRPAV